MQLIKIDNRQIAQQSAQTVNARELHASLEVGKDFSNWVKAQITRARLVENRDFVKVAQKGELSSTGQTVIEYHLTIEAAKHIAMVSGTDKGFEVREYFIECERRTKEMPAPMSLQDALGDPEMVRGMLLVYTNKVIALQKQVTEHAPKVQALDLIATESDGAMCITNAAKHLQMQPKRLFAWLQEHQWIYRRAGGSGFIAYQARIQVRYLEHKVTTVERSDGTVKMVEQVLVTPKGLAKLAGDVLVQVAA